MMPESPRTVVFGYSEVGYRCLKLLIERGVNVVAVITHVDDPDEAQWFQSVAGLADAHGITTFMPESLRGASWQARFRDEFKPDLIFSFYYRNMIPMRILDLAPLGAFNMHGSYLPEYRGKAPVNWAVLHGADHIGATLHHMVAKPDAGDIVDQEMVEIGPGDSAGAVMNRVTEAAARVIDRQLDALLVGQAPRTPQDHSQASYFGGRRPEDGRIDWNQPTSEIYNLIRAVTKPYPGAFADLDEGRRLRVWWATKHDGAAAPGHVLSERPLRIGTADGVLEITEFTWEQIPKASIKQ